MSSVACHRFGAAAKDVRHSIGGARERVLELVEVLPRSFGRTAEHTDAYLL